MQVTPQAALVRNLLVALANGGITLIILLIAPLGLAAVIINTLLVTVASYFVGTTADRVVGYLSQGTSASMRGEVLPEQRSEGLQRREDQDVDQR